MATPPEATASILARPNVGRADRYDVIFPHETRLHMLHHDDLELYISPKDPPAPSDE